ncbi:hypothetical protein [Paenisporosarcina sp. NPDC076898]|uniref:hypothetical protein n=1 Tax=unclassified Paenisporosarcina TaxID=2642018 RepID=UPI003D045EAD
MKKISFLGITIIFCLVLSFTIKVKADEFQFEKLLYDIGYKEVNKAYMESTNHFKRDIALPSQLPPIAFTHNLGRFSNLEGNANDSFQITYLNKDIAQNHYQIRVKPVKYKLEFSKEKIDHKVKLNDGSEAIYSTKMPLDLLAFEKNEWQYILLVDKRISKSVSLKVLVDIANSVQ